MKRPVPILPALVTPARPGRSAQAHAWCPWCETIHSHSPDPGPRAPHCVDKASPYRVSGYSLDVVGAAATADAVMPMGPLVGRTRFMGELDAVAPGLRIALLRYVAKRLRATSARVRTAGNAWTLHLDPAAMDGGPQLDGVGHLSLVAAVWGITPGVVVVRLVEALHGRKLDASARAGLVDAVDAATSRPSASAGGAA